MACAKCGCGTRSTLNPCSCCVTLGACICALVLHVFVCCLLWCGSSTPPRVAAVLSKNSSLWYTDCAPDEAVLNQFRIRGDNQIASLEMLTIAYGWCMCSACAAHACVRVRFLTRPVDLCKRPQGTQGSGPQRQHRHRAWNEKGTRALLRPHCGGAFSLVTSHGECCSM